MTALDPYHLITTKTAARESILWRRLGGGKVRPEVVDLTPDNGGSGQDLLDYSCKAAIP